MKGSLSGVKREVRKIARLGSRTLSGIFGLKINTFGVYACREDWVYVRLDIPTLRLTKSLQEAGIPSVVDIRCLIDDEAPEECYVQNGILYINEMRI